MADISSMKRAHTNIDLFMDKFNIKTDKELAKALKWTQSALSQRINGNISMNTMESLASFFNTTVKELLR